MITTFNHTETFTVVTCCVCSTPFGLPDPLNRRLLEKGCLFYCPNGHSQSYVETVQMKYQRQIEAERERAENLNQALESERMKHEHTRRRMYAAKGALTKTKKRIAAGICPCCNRGFENLHRHMKSQHPEYIGDNGEASN